MEVDNDSEQICDGLPMTPEQMREYLQQHHGIPVVLRERGQLMVKCPYCAKLHSHEPGPGHHPAACDDRDRDIGISNGDRFFVPNYGYLLLEYKADGNVNKLLN